MIQNLYAISQSLGALKAQTHAFNKSLAQDHYKKVWQERILTPLAEAFTSERLTETVRQAYHQCRNLVFIKVGISEHYTFAVCLRSQDEGLTITLHNLRTYGGQPCNNNEIMPQQFHQYGRCLPLVLESLAANPILLARALGEGVLKLFLNDQIKSVEQELAEAERSGDLMATAPMFADEALLGTLNRLRSHHTLLTDQLAELERLATVFPIVNTVPKPDPVTDDDDVDDPPF